MDHGPPADRKNGRLYVLRVYTFERGTKRAPNRTADRKISYDVAADGGCVFWPDMALSPYKAPKYIAKRTQS